MPYCLYCGKLRDTVGGRCEQCRRDKLAKDKAARGGLQSRIRAPGEPSRAPAALLP